MKTKKLTQKILKENFRYEPETGNFIRLIATGRHGSHKAGVVVGFSDSRDGRSYIRFNGTLYLAHRLVWMYENGYFPETEIDHINRDPSDNRICNLRVVSHQCNMRNCKLRASNTSGITGVYWRKDINKWCARLNDGKIFHSLGVYYNIIDAAYARWEAEKKYNFPDCNSTSSAYLYLQTEGEI